MTESGQGQPCEPLPWDSEHFGLSIAQVAGGALSEERAAAADAWCAERGVDCLYLLAPPMTPRPPGWPPATAIGWST